MDYGDLRGERLVQTACDRGGEGYGGQRKDPRDTYPQWEFPSGDECSRWPTDDPALPRLTTTDRPITPPTDPRPVVGLRVVKRLSRSQRGAERQSRPAARASDSSPKRSSLTTTGPGRPWWSIR